MNEKITIHYKGITQHAWLLTTGYGDMWDEQHRQPMAYVSGLDYEWFDYIPLEGIPDFCMWCNDLEKFPISELCLVAKANTNGGFLKGWAAMTLLTKGATAMTSRELITAIEAAGVHCKTLIGRNALEILQEESDRREFGRDI